VTAIVDSLEETWDDLNTRGLWSIADENYYLGEKDEQNQRHGLGALALPNGDYYVGYWKQNMRHGYGKTLTGYSLEEVQEVYMAQWRFDEPHGLGRYKTADGYLYEGEFLSGRQDGFGVFYWGQMNSLKDDFEKVVSKYTGEWKFGKQHGSGIYETDKIIHEGVWIDGKRNGLAKITNKANGQVVYKMFKDDTIVNKE